MKSSFRALAAAVGGATLMAASSARAQDISECTRYNLVTQSGGPVRSFNTTVQEYADFKTCVMFLCQAISGQQQIVSANCNPQRVDPENPGKAGAAFTPVYSNGRQKPGPVTYHYIVPGVSDEVVPPPPGCPPCVPTWQEECGGSGINPAAPHP